MRRTAWQVLLFTLVFSILVVACGSATPTLSPPTEPAALSPDPGEAYPAPAAAAPVYNPYPGPSEGVTNYIEWSQAESAIMDGLVSQVFEAATLHVTLVMKDGSVMLASEPTLDDVTRVIERCGDVCKDIEKINP